MRLVSAAIDLELRSYGLPLFVCTASLHLRRFPEMTQTSNRFFDEIGRLMNDAAGAAQGVKREVDTVVRNQAEKILRDLDIVKREEFEAVKDMARLAREENEALKARIAALEAKLGASPPAPMPAARRRTAELWRRHMAARLVPLGCGRETAENPRISLSFRDFGARTPPRPQPPHPWRLAAACNGPRCGL